MLATCQSFRDRWLERPDEVEAEAALDHRAHCAACRAWVARARAARRALFDLPRQATPFELEGRVVAALEAGARQLRAAGFLQDLGRVDSPRELEGAVQAGLDAQARAGAEGDEAGPGEAISALRVPTVLDRLVAEELSEPSKARARRYLGSLRRRRAPAVLWARLASEIQSGAPGSGMAGELPGGRAKAPRTLMALVAAGLVLWLAPRVLRESSPAQPAARGYAFTVHRAAAGEPLPGIAASLLGGIDGGLSSLSPH